jgi:CBS domain-containing protein
MPMSAADIMTRRVITVRLDVTVAEIARVLAARGISAVPVCDSDGQLLGMISEADLLQPFGQEYTLHRSWWLSLLAQGVDVVDAFRNYVQRDSRHASDLMKSPVVTVSADAELAEVAHLLMRHRVKRLPVMRAGKLVGIVSRADVIMAVAQLRAEMGRLAHPVGRAGSHNPLS